MKKKIFTTYLVIFYLLWLIYVYGFSPYLLPTHLSPTDYALFNLVARILTWILPAIIYVNIVNAQESESSESRVSLRFWGITLDGILAALIVPAVIFTMNWFALGTPRIDLKLIDTNLILNTLIFVPIIEEFVFRGVIINSLEKVFNISNTLARNLITSALFLLIHIPGWLLYSPSLQLYSALSLFILSLILGYLVQRHKSIVPTIIVHSMNNVFSTILWR